MEPKIRFTNIIGPWSVKTIGEMYKFKNGLNKGKESFGFGTPIINYTDVYKHRGLTKEKVKGLVKLDANEIRRYRVKKGDVFFTRTSETPEEVGFASVLLEDIDDCSFSGFVLRGRPITDDLEFDYCKECFSVRAVREYIVKTCTYTTRALTNGTVLSKIPITIPPKEEQKAIASYFTNLDALIQSTAKKIESLKQVKAASYQSMFPQEGKTSPRVRFNGFEGEWETVLVGKMGTTYSGLSGKTKDDFGIGEARFVTFLNVLTNAIIDTSILEAVNVFEGENQNEVRKGDLLFNTSSETPEEVGMCAVMDEELTNVYLNSFCFGFRVTDENIDSTFIAYLMRSPIGRRIMSILAQGATRYNLSKNSFCKAELLLPKTKAEQQQIANYFTSLDSQIALQMQRLKKLKQIKSACLDDMFV